MGIEKSGTLQMGNGLPAGEDDSTKPAQRVSLAAMAVIREGEAEERRWLTRWNRRWGAFNLAGGHKKPDETFHECVNREIQEELGLRPGLDFAAADKPLAHLEYSAWSVSACERTDYVMELFRVDLCGDSARRAIAGSCSNRWLTEREIHDGKTADGEPVSETVRRFLGAVFERLKG